MSCNTGRFMVGFFIVARLFGPAFLFDFAKEDMVLRDEAWGRRGRWPLDGMMIGLNKNTTGFVSRIDLAGNPPCDETAARCK